MDVSDIKLMLQLPLAHDKTFLNELIGKMLELENIPYNQPPMLSMKKGSLKLPSTSNTDWTRKATGESFLEPVQDEESTKHQTSNEECLSKSRGQQAQKAKLNVENVSMLESKKIKLQADYPDNPNDNVQVSQDVLLPCGENVALDGQEFGGQSNQNFSAATIIYPDTLISEDSGDGIFFSKINKEGTENVTLDAAAMDQVVSLLVKAQKKFCTETPKPGSNEWTELRHSQAVFRANSGELPALRPIAQKKEDKIRIVRHFIKAFERIIQECVKFAKQIPGFRDLQIGDQISLIRECRQVSHFPGTLRSVNEEQRVITPLLDMHFLFEYFSELSSEAIVRFIIEQSRTSIAKRTLIEEDALIKAILITNPDHCEDLKNRKAVEHIHSNMIASLLFVVRKTSKDVSQRKKEIESLLHDCRQFSILFRSNFKENLTRIAGGSENWEVIDTL